MTYYLRFGNYPLCDHMGSQAGRQFCETFRIESCSYRTIKEARAVLRRVDRSDWAGALSIKSGTCPRLADVK